MMGLVLFYSTITTYRAAAGKFSFFAGIAALGAADKGKDTVTLRAAV